MSNSTRWIKLDEEQAKLLGNPTERQYELMVEVARLQLAHRCLEAAARQRIEELETLVITMRHLDEVDCRAHRKTALDLELVVGQAAAFVTELSQLLQREGLRLCEQNPAEVQAVIDRFQDQLTEYQ